MIEITRSRERPRAKYISQIMKDAGSTSHREFKDMENVRKKMKKAFVMNKFVKNQPPDWKIKKVGVYNP